MIDWNDLIIKSKDITTVFGTATIIITFLTVTIKPLRERFTYWIRKKSNTCDLENKIDTLNMLVKEHIEKDTKKTEILAQLTEAQLCILRNSITETYYKYKNSDGMPLHIREKLIKEYECYHAMNGNSFVDVIYPEMINWDVMD